MYLPTYLLTHACLWERVKRGYRNQGHPTPFAWLLLRATPPSPPVSKQVLHYAAERVGSQIQMHCTLRCAGWTVYVLWHVHCIYPPIRRLNSRCSHLRPSLSRASSRKGAGVGGGGRVAEGRGARRFCWSRPIVATLPVVEGKYLASCMVVCVAWLDRSRAIRVGVGRDASELFTLLRQIFILPRGPSLPNPLAKSHTGDFMNIRQNKSTPSGWIFGRLKDRPRFSHTHRQIKSNPTDNLTVNPSYFLPPPSPLWPAELNSDPFFFLIEARNYNKIITKFRSMDNGPSRGGHSQNQVAWPNETHTKVNARGPPYVPKCSLFPRALPNIKSWHFTLRGC
jgi:hypothetical protein